jgi:spoIIIJ-associated protein
MEFMEFSAKTVNDCITEACQKFGVTSDKLEHEVITEGSTGFLGFNAKPAVIKAWVKLALEDNVKNFLNSDFIKSLDIINEYHEYAYFDNLGHKSIIDLILETEDKMYIIDYKLSNVDNPHYIEQLSKYKEYLKTITDKEIEIYLYSLFKKEFKKLN